MDTETKPNQADEKLLNLRKRERIAEALKADPNRSDRVIARETETSQPTTYRVRKQLERDKVIPIVNPVARKYGLAGDRTSYSAKIRALIRDEFKRDPNRSDRAIALVTKTASNTVWTVRREMEAAGEIKPVKISERKTVGGFLGMNRGAGTKIQTPAGMSVSDHVASGLKLEHDKGLKQEEAAKAIRVSTKAYRQVRSLIVLSRNPDLTKGDAMLVADTLEKINRDCFVGAHWRDVEPLVKRVWGDNRPQGMNEAALRKRKAAFHHALSLTSNTCDAATEVEIPLLSEDERGDAYESLTEAISNLTKLRGKIRRGL